MPDDPKVAALVSAVEGAIVAALAPVAVRLRALEGASAGLAGVQATIDALAAAPPVPGPPGADGAPGPPGVDGRGVDTVDCEYDGERTVTFAWTRGGVVDTRAIVLPLMLYRGVHVPGRLYERGDCVTLDGSIFHCNADTTTRPGNGGAWTLAVKHGRDAR
jgi:hypothetical protein